MDLTTLVLSLCLQVHAKELTAVSAAFDGIMCFSLNLHRASLWVLRNDIA